LNDVLTGMCAPWARRSIEPKAAISTLLCGLSINLATLPIWSRTHQDSPSSNTSFTRFYSSCQKRKGQTTNMRGKQFFNFRKAIFSVCQTNMILVQQISEEIAVTIPGTCTECILEIMTCMIHCLWWRQDLSDSAQLHIWIKQTWQWNTLPCIHVYYVHMICSEYDYVDIYTHYTCISNYTVHIITIYCKAHWNKQNGAEAPPNWQM